MIRPMHACDLAAVHGLAQRMSWPHRLEDCATLFELGNGAVAVDEKGETVGVGMRWTFGRDTGTVGMVLVAPERQGKGIGRALMTTLISELAPRALLLNATAEGLGLYEKLGFVPTGLVRQHQSPWWLASATPPAPTIPVRRAVPADHASLCALDAAAFGADRSALIARLLAAGEAWLVERSGRPAGFAALRTFGRGRMIGPVVAASEDLAIALVSAAARAVPPGLLRIDVPAHADRLGSWLAAAGLPSVDIVTAMVRGNWPATQKELQRFGLALQALG
jgi:GNAT superfamily N-acetyltransferase